MKIKSFRPNVKPGDKLTLAFDHWNNNAKAGQQVEVTNVRKDSKCKGGFRISVLINNKIEKLGIMWFKEFNQ